ncbi:MAG: hypothetical protein ABW219_05660 [Ilumatobacteraceae bacterium]
MVFKQVVLSDLSGDELTDDTHVRVVVQHPDLPTAVELDVSAAEADKLASTTLRLVELTIHAPNVPPRSVTMETKVLDRLFAGVDVDQVLEGARAVDLARVPPSQRGRTPVSTPPARSAGADKGEKIDYTAPDRYGQLHRGRLTDEERELVRANREQASRNRQAQGHPPIDWDDDKEKTRYGL